MKQRKNHQDTAEAEACLGVKIPEHQQTNKGYAIPVTWSKCIC